MFSKMIATIRLVEKTSQNAI